MTAQLKKMDALPRNLALFCLELLTLKLFEVLDYKTSVLFMTFENNNQVFTTEY